MDTYEKKYNEALERAKELIAKWTGRNKDFYTDDYAYIFPELRESEDEEPRKRIEQLIRLNTSGAEKTHLLAYLEKQKDIEKRWLEDREGCFWDGVAEGRAQKEQKPVEWNDTDMKEARQNLIICCIDWEKGLGTTLLPKVAKRARYFLEQYIKPPVEWSEEDEDRIRQIERIAQQAGCTQKLQEEIHDWLKSLRPSWKPSEEQIECLRKVVYDAEKKHAESTSGYDDFIILRSLLQELIRQL